MAQTTQIIPKYPFPYVEVVTNDYTAKEDVNIEATADTSYKQAYAVRSSKGIDRIWVRKTSKASAVQSFGKSEFKKFGQPLMQAMNVVDQDNTTVWFMRVTPDDATYANTSVVAWYYGDKAADYAEDPTNMKFHVSFTGRNYKAIKDASKVAKFVDDDIAMNDFTTPQFIPEGLEEPTAEDYVDLANPTSIMNVRYTGRGKCGNLYSLRMTTVPTYERELGIKMYSFESITSENGLVKDATYVGSMVTSAKYGAETVTLINDILSDTAPGVAPIDIVSNEENVEAVYDAYMAWINTEYRPTMEEYLETCWNDLSDDTKSGIIPNKNTNPTEYAKYVLYKKVEGIVDQLQATNLPDYDQFDIFFGSKLGVSMTSDDSSDFLPGYKVEKPVNDIAEGAGGDSWSAADYKGHYSDYVVDFTSVKGATFAGGTDGIFDSVLPNGTARSYDGSGNPLDENGVAVNLDTELADEYDKAFNGTYDKLILSSKRMDISAFFDANYPFSVKTTIANLCLTRNTCRAWLDVGIIEALDYPVLNNLIADYSIFTDKALSVDIHNYLVREDTTNKKYRVSITYFLSAAWCYHMNYVGFQIPFVRGNCQLDGHIRDSLRPIIEDYDVGIKTKLYENRFNYFECLRENVFVRGVQNTRQVEDSDMLEENDVQIYFTLKNAIEQDLYGMLYNFTSQTERSSFVAYEKAKYSDWEGSIVEKFNIYFNISKWEFNHDTIHCYLDITFRGLNKRIIQEIDLNKREYAENSFSADID